MSNYNTIPQPIIKGTRPASGNPAGKLKNIEWLRQHHQEYQGQWIALSSGQLLGANANFLELFKAMDHSEQLKVAVFINLKTDL
jgi:hypothetical protein